jgi:hypothetical protein
VSSIECLETRDPERWPDLDPGMVVVFTWESSTGHDADLDGVLVREVCDKPGPPAPYEPSDNDKQLPYPFLSITEPDPLYHPPGWIDARQCANPDNLKFCIATHLPPAGYPGNAYNAVQWVEYSCDDGATWRKLGGPYVIEHGLEPVENQPKWWREWVSAHGETCEQLHHDISPE